MQNVVETVVQSEALPDQDASDHWLLLPTGKSFVNNQTVFNTEEKNNAIVYYLQVGETLTDSLRTKLALFSHLIGQRAFDILRTKEQLGYVVHCYQWMSPTVMGLNVIIQSEQSPTYLENRIDAFLEDYGKELSDMELEDFEKQRAGLVGKLREKLENLEGEYSRFSYWIETGTYDFRRSKCAYYFVSFLSRFLQL